MKIDTTTPNWFQHVASQSGGMHMASCLTTLKFLGLEKEDAKKLITDFIEKEWTNFSLHPTNVGDETDLGPELAAVLNAEAGHD